MIDLGTRVGSWQVEGLLGRGGQAEVWRIRHQTLGSPAALKVLRVTNSMLERRLIQEGRVQANLAHPNIVRVMDVVEVDGALGLVLEYVDGPTLEDWLRRFRPSLEQAEALFRNIAEAVAHAHAHGVIHRDLKPANVLLAEAGGRIVPKVADFGLARILEEGGTGTRSHVGMGTPLYMAPEQMRDARGADVRADVFSLGCILMELVTGLRPYRSTDVIGYFEEVRAARWSPPSAVLDGVPPRFDLATAGALRFEVDERIPSVEELLGVLSDGARPATPPMSLKAPAPGTARVGVGSAPETLPPSRPNSEPTWAGGVDEAEPARVETRSAPSGFVAAGATRNPASLPEAPGTASITPTPMAPPPPRSVVPVVLGTALLTVGLVLGGLYVFLRLGPQPDPQAVAPQDATLDAPLASPSPSTAVGPGVGAAAPVEPPGAPSVPADPASSAPSSAGGAPTTALPVTSAAKPVVSAPTRAPDAAAQAAPAAGPASSPASTAAVAEAPAEAPVPVTEAPAPKATFRADAEFDVRLEGAAGTFAAGQSVPPGDYTVTALFDGARKKAGSATIQPGATLNIRCTIAGGRCVAR